MSTWSHPTVYFQHKRRVSSFSGLQFFPSFDDEWFFAWPGKILWCALETNSLWEGHSQLAKVSVGWLLGFPCHFSVRTASPPGRSSRSFSLSHTVAASPVRLTFRRGEKKKKDFRMNQQEGHLSDKHKRSQQVSGGLCHFENGNYLGGLEEAETPVSCCPVCQLIVSVPKWGGTGRDSPCMLWICMCISVWW